MQPKLNARNRKKIAGFIERINVGAFDTSELELLLIYVRQYVQKSSTLWDLANFVGHPEARDRGLSNEQVTHISDSFNFFREFSMEKQTFDIARMPHYAKRLLLSQARHCNNEDLRQFRLSKATLLQKISLNVVADETTKTFHVRSGKDGQEFLSALRYLFSAIRIRPAFSLETMLFELNEYLESEGLPVVEKASEVQFKLCTLKLLDGVEFALPDGEIATTYIDIEKRHRIISGHIRNLGGHKSNYPSEYGTLGLTASIPEPAGKKSVGISFQVISTDLNPRDLVDLSKIRRESGDNEFGPYEIESIDVGQPLRIVDWKVV